MDFWQAKGVPGRSTKLPRRNRIAIRPQPSVQGTGGLLLARVERPVRLRERVGPGIEPGEAGFELFQSDIAACALHFRHNAPVAIDRGDIHSQRARGEQAKKRLARTLAKRLPSFRSVDAAQSDANPAAAFVANLDGVAVEDFHERCAEGRGISGCRDRDHQRESNALQHNSILCSASLRTAFFYDR
jgi:hypothetical protein